MPLTVITVKNVPPSLRGDLTKWMQEIATGVYVGNFNTKIREELWERVRENSVSGEATISFAFRNEIGYHFETFNTQRKVIDYDGIPLVQLFLEKSSNDYSNKNVGFSDASKFHMARKYLKKSDVEIQTHKSFVVLTIETTGLNKNGGSIIEVGAIKVGGMITKEFHSLVKQEKELSRETINLTGITHQMLENEGLILTDVIEKLYQFIDDHMIVGYGIDFDFRLINEELQRMDKEPIKNRVIDLLKFVKKEKMFLENYQLNTVLQAYDIFDEETHQALNDSKLIYTLCMKVNKFRKVLEQEC